MEITKGGRFISNFRSSYTFHVTHKKLASFFKLPKAYQMHLGSTQHNVAQQIIPKLNHGRFSLTRISIARNWINNALIEEGVM